MLGALPHREAVVGLGSPVAVEFVSPEEASLTGGRYQDAGVDHAFDGDAAGGGESLRVAVGAGLHALRLEPGDGEARPGVVVGVLGGEDLVELRVDQGRAPSGRSSGSRRLRERGNSG